MEEYTAHGRELRSHGTPDFPVGIYTGSLKGSPVPLHWHSEMEAGFVTAGTVQLLVGKNRTTLRAGDGFFVNSGIPHAFLPGKEEESAQKSLVFDPGLVGGQFGSVFWQKYAQPVVSATAMPWILLDQEEAWKRDAVKAIRRGWTACAEGEPAFEVETRYALSRLLVLLSEHLPVEQLARAKGISRDNDRIRSMLRFVRAHMQEPITAGDIAASAMISPSEALRCFHSTIGMTPVQYLKTCRIQQAAELLRTTDRKISEIGASCGFQEMSYFAKAFREQLGMPPGAYRDRYRQPERGEGTEAPETDLA